MLEIIDKHLMRYPADFPKVHSLKLFSP